MRGRYADPEWWLLLVWSYLIFAYRALAWRAWPWLVAVVRSFAES